MKYTDIQGLKDKIIYNVLKYLETKEIVNKNNALEQLKIFAKHFHVSVRKRPKIDTKNALYAFILNDSGYQETILKLFYSL